MTKKPCSVSAKVAKGTCLGRDGRYAVSEICASLSDDEVQLRFVTSKCHRGIASATITPAGMDELAAKWLVARGLGRCSGCTQRKSFMEALRLLGKIGDEANGFIAVKVDERLAEKDPLGGPKR